MKRDELALLTNLSGDTVVPRAEAARLRNENLALRKQLEDERVLAHGGSIENKPHDKHTKAAAAKKSGLTNTQLCRQVGRHPRLDFAQVLSRHRGAGRKSAMPTRIKLMIRKI